MTKFVGRDLTFSIAAPAIASLTSVAATDVFTSATHGFALNDAVVFNSPLTGGAGLVTGKRYYVIAGSFTATTFQVSATIGGASFDHTTNITAGTVSKFNGVGQLLAIGDAGSSRDLIDASVYGDVWKDYLTGQSDGAEVDVELALDPALTGHIAMKTAYDGGLKTTFAMYHAGAALDIAFPALVTSYMRGAERDGLLHASATLKIVNPGVTDTP